MLDRVGGIMQYEAGELTVKETIDLFQRLINSGLVWKLDEHYGKMANALLKNGLCEKKDASTCTES